MLFNKISIYVKNRKDGVRREGGKGLIEGGGGGGGEEIFHERDLLA